MTKQAKLLIPALVVVAVSATIWYSRISLVWVVALVAAMLVNAFIAAYEDDIPGGFNNPDGTSIPTYVRTVGRISKIVCALLCGTVAIVILAAAARGAIDWITGMLFAVASVSLGAALLCPRPAVQWAALLVAFVAFACAIWRGPAASNTALQADERLATVIAKRNMAPAPLAAER